MPVIKPFCAYRVNVNFSFGIIAHTAIVSLLRYISPTKTRGGFRGTNEVVGKRWNYRHDVMRPISSLLAPQTDSSYRTVTSAPHNITFHVPKPVIFYFSQ